MSDFKLEVSDLIGLSKPLTKLIDVVSKSCGTVYKPRAMRKEAEAKAYEILVIGRAELALDKERNQLASVSDTSLPVYDPNPMNRAHTRVSFKESQRQSNIEAIADIASENMPEEIADEAPNEDWMTRFFNHAQDISDPRMQELWGKILGGEVASPSSFGLRTLDILRTLSQNEAEMFQLACHLSFHFGAIIKLSDNDKLGLEYEALLSLRDAGLIHIDDRLSYAFTDLEKNPQGLYFVHIENNGKAIQLSHSSLEAFRFPIYGFTTAGKELSKLIPKTPNHDYLNAFVKEYKSKSFIIKEMVEASPDVFSFEDYTIA